MTTINVTLSLGDGVSVVGPTFWAHTGINGKVVGMACGFVAAMFLLAVAAAKWLSHTRDSPKREPVELTSVVTEGGTPEPGPPTPAEAVRA
ncbi:hypothetical protein EV426DRAFT_707474 [Tirmania nivea]|nr:hypothetical protein EV426DRAFT_707474 [Tirmania nivea]